MALRGGIKQILARDLVLIAVFLLPNIAPAGYQDDLLKGSHPVVSSDFYGSQRKHPVIADSRTERGQNSTRKPPQKFTPQQRKQLKQRHQRFEALPPKEQERIRKARKQFRELPAERRQELRRKWDSLPPEERIKRRSNKKGENHGNNRYRASRA
jgi:hypothetical protein